MTQYEYRQHLCDERCDYWRHFWRLGSVVSFLGVMVGGFVTVWYIFNLQYWWALAWSTLTVVYLALTLFAAREAEHHEPPSGKASSAIP